MTHLHLPDGAIPWWLWLPGLVLAAILLGLVSRRHRGDGPERLALVATMSALMLAAMSLPLGPLGYHLSLAPVVGVLLGSGPAFLAAAVVNGMLALLGHGGLTAIGLNTLILGTAAALGRRLYLLLAPSRGPFWAAALASAGAHAGAMIVFLAVVGAAGLAPNPGELGGGHLHGGAPSAATIDVALDRLGRFAALSAPFWAIGIAAESLVAGGVVGFLARVNPALLPALGARSGERMR